MAGIMGGVVQRFGMRKADAVDDEYTEHHGKHRRRQTRCEGERNRSRSTSSSHNNLRAGPEGTIPFGFGHHCPMTGRSPGSRVVSSMPPSRFPSGCHLLSHPAMASILTALQSRGRLRLGRPDGYGPSHSLLIPWPLAKTGTNHGLNVIHQAHGMSNETVAFIHPPTCGGKRSPHICRRHNL